MDISNPFNVLTGCFIVHGKGAVDEFHKVLRADSSIAIRRCRSRINTKGAAGEILSDARDHRWLRGGEPNRCVKGKEKGSYGAGSSAKAH